MDKEYMIYAIDARLQVLEKRYKNLCLNRDEDGNDISESVATVYRCKVKRDYQILVLIKVLLSKSTSDFVIKEDDAIDAFMKLVEPKEKKRA